MNNRHTAYTPDTECETLDRCPHCGNDRMIEVDDDRTLSSIDFADTAMIFTAYDTRCLVCGQPFDMSRTRLVSILNSKMRRVVISTNDELGTIHSKYLNREIANIIAVEKERYECWTHLLYRLESYKKRQDDDREVDNITRSMIDKTRLEKTIAFVRSMDWRSATFFTDEEWTRYSEGDYSARKNWWPPRLSRILD